MIRVETPVAPGRSVPWEIERYAAEPPQLGLGRPGKVGVLRLELASVEGKTRIVRRFSRVPLQTLKALYCDPARPDLAFVYVTSVAGGVLQGDRLTIDVLARAGSRAHLTTQAMTKVYRMTHGYASQTVHLRAEPGSYLEYLPDPTIPFRGARYFQELTLEPAPGATILAGEILLPGRTASGESFAYDTVCFTTRGVDWRPERNAPTGDAGLIPGPSPFASEGRGAGGDGRSFPEIPRFQDTLLFEPSRQDPHAIGLLGPFSVIGTLFVLSDLWPVASLVDALASVASPGPDLALAATALPNGAGAMLRVLSRTSAGAQRALIAAWAAARCLFLGEGMPTLRKY